MNNFKKSLLKEIDAHIVSSLKAVDEHQEIFNACVRAKNEFDRFDEKNTLYYVTLNSLWRDEGGKSVAYKHKGNLQDAILIAEENFMKANEISEPPKNGFPAYYAAAAVIEEQFFDIPLKVFERWTLGKRKNIKLPLSEKPSDLTVW